MSKIEWEIKKFHQLSIDQFFDFLQLRIDVFVVEQQCAYRELDMHDRHAETSHISGHDKGGQLIAYARLLPPGLRYPEVNLGRFVVKAEWRKQGIGHQLLQAALKEISCCWPKNPIRISAQDYLQAFYAQYGFTRVSDVFLEDGIPHVEMVKES